MRGTIVNFKLGNKYNGKKVILEIENTTSFRIASQLIGKKVIWIHPQNKEKIIGKIVKIHGRRGRVLAIFRNPLPGIAIGKTVNII